MNTIRSASTISVRMTLKKITTGTFVYEGDLADGAAISTLYIRKRAFAGSAPQQIEVIVKEILP